MRRGPESTEKTFQVFVESPLGCRIVDCEPGWRVRNLYDVISSTMPFNPDRWWFAARGRRLRAEQCLHAYANDSICMFLRLRGGAGSKPTQRKSQPVATDNDVIGSSDADEDEDQGEYEDEIAGQQDAAANGPRDDEKSQHDDESAAANTAREGVGDAVDEPSPSSPLDEQSAFSDDLQLSDEDDHLVPDADPATGVPDLQPVSSSQMRVPPALQRFNKKDMAALRAKSQSNNLPSRDPSELVTDVVALLPEMKWTLAQNAFHRFKALRTRVIARPGAGPFLACGSAGL